MIEENDIRYRMCPISSAMVSRARSGGIVSQSVSRTLASYGVGRLPRRWNARYDPPLECTETPLADRSGTRSDRVQ